jgi:hypothetical protein
MFMITPQPAQFCPLGLRNFEVYEYFGKTCFNVILYGLFKTMLPNVFLKLIF